MGVCQGMHDMRKVSCSGWNGYDCHASTDVAFCHRPPSTKPISSGMHVRALKLLVSPSVDVTACAVVSTIPTSARPIWYSIGCDFLVYLRCSTDALEMTHVMPIVTRGRFASWYFSMFFSNARQHLSSWAMPQSRPKRAAKENQCVERSKPHWMRLG